MLAFDNIFAAMPAHLPEELVEVLLATEKINIVTQPARTKNNAKESRIPF